MTQTGQDRQWDETVGTKWQSLFHTNKTATQFIRVNKLKSQSSVRSECPTNYTCILLTIKKNIVFLSLYYSFKSGSSLNISTSNKPKYLHKVQDEGKVHGSCHMKPHNNHAITQHTFYTSRFDRTVLNFKALKLQTAEWIRSIIK